MSDQLLGVIIGAFITVGVLLIGQVLTHRFTRHREREKLIREKGEELIRSLYKHRTWINNLRNNLWFGDGDHDSDDPSDISSTLRYLYFKDCVEIELEFDAAALAFSDYVRLQAIEKLQNPQQWIGQHEERAARIGELSRAYLEKNGQFRQAVIREIDVLIARETPFLDKLIFGRA